MAFTHTAVHVVVTGGVVGDSYDELSDAVSVAETDASLEEGRISYILHATKVVEVP